MRNHWTNFYIGNVEIGVSGEQVEAFVNDLARRNIHVWNLRRDGDGDIFFRMSLKDVPAMRAVHRRHRNCKVIFRRRAGLPFLLKRAWRNSGFVIGAALFLFCLFLLSNIVWNIEVTGAKPETEYRIRNELKDMGIEKGKFQFFLSGSDDIQKQLTKKIDALTWIGVELRGTSFHLQVVEKKEPKKTEASGRQNLVANKKAIIRKVFVEKGKAVVQVNDYVHKGQLLVSSNISNGKGTELVAAKGEVLGEIWYKSTVTIPLKTHFNVYSGWEETKHYIGAGKVSLPVWGFKKNKMESFEKDVTKKPLFFLGYKLPFTYDTVTYRDKETVIREYSKQEAIKKGQDTAESDLGRLIPKNSEVIGRNILHEGLENGKVVLKIHYQVLENIAIEQPIIQGD